MSQYGTTINRHVMQTTAKIQKAVVAEAMVTLEKDAGPRLTDLPAAKHILEDVFVAGLETGRGVRYLDESIVKRNPSTEGSYYWGDKPLDRIRESSGDHIYDECRGILAGFKATLEARQGWMDLITMRQASDEIKELIIKCGGDPDKYKV